MKSITTCKCVVYYSQTHSTSSEGKGPNCSMKPDRVLYFILGLGV